MHKYIFTFTLSVLAINSAFASDNDLYAAVNVGTSSIDVSTAQFGKYKSNIFSYAIAGGYQVNKFFSTEIAYVGYGTARTNVPVLSSNPNAPSSFFMTTTPASVSVRAMQISGIGNLPLNENLSLTGRLGYSINKANSQTPTLTLTNTEVSANGTVMNTVRLDTVHTSESSGRAVLGIGIKYKLTNNSELRAEYSAISHISSSDISTLMIGLAYRFK